ncbi:MAG: hydroxymethylglutaryl-CoA lyase [Pseudomonadales bacterium]|nr:hydroxymethylglutaryl-CoA lyase [Pseudomonadales bacterium]
MQLPKHVRLVEVGPRDGLQNESTPVSAETKIELINRLSDAGIVNIESSSFVSPKWVPQMGDAKSVFSGITYKEGVTYSALTPNMRGLEGAIESDVKEVAVFVAATDEFNQKNLNRTTKDCMAQIEPVVVAALEQGIKVRSYVSCIMGCPYAGDVNPAQVAALAKELVDLGCYEVSLGDTIGKGTPLLAQTVFEETAKLVPINQLAAHFHDTYGQALANLLAVLQLGVSVIDSSVAGLGGCPYAKGASGNVATEDVLYMLKGLNIETGIDLPKVIAAGNFITEHLGRANTSKIALAGFSG